MFGKMPAKAEKTISKESKVVAKSKGGLSNFLSSSSLKTSNKEINSKSNSDKENGPSVPSSMDFDSETSIKTEDLTSFMELAMDEGEFEDQDIKAPLTEKKESFKSSDKHENVKEKEKVKRKSNKRQRDHSEGNSTKRRKRIVVRDDSDSDGT